MAQRPILLGAALWLGLATQAIGQLKQHTAAQAEPGQTVVTHWRVGMVVSAEGSPFQRIVGTTTVPMDWALEQRVKVVQEDLSSGVTVSYQSIEGVARQMLVRIPALAAGEEARAIVTFEIKRLLSGPPENTDAYLLPPSRPADRKLAAFLGPSPLIESTHPEIVQLAKQVGADQSGAWKRVEALYDKVRQQIEFQDNRGGPVKSALQALRDGTGDCDEMTSLFVALCRASGIPARTVRVPGHCYPEFYLLDPQGKGRWFACQAAGTRAFGFMPDPRPILQKGDNLLVTDPKTKKKSKVRFLPETLVGFPTTPGGNLRLRLVCEPTETAPEGG